MGGIGWKEILLILFVVVLLFGAKRLPELARGMGKSIKEFKKATAEAENEDDEDDDHEADAPNNGTRKKKASDVASKN